MGGKTWRLSPSDFAFLWQECKRCFYLKNVVGFQRPRSIMPRIFNVIDAQMKDCFMKMRTEKIAPGMPPVQGIGKGSGSEGIGVRLGYVNTRYGDGAGVGIALSPRVAQLEETGREKGTGYFSGDLRRGYLDPG